MNIHRQLLELAGTRITPHPPRQSQQQLLNARLPLLQRVRIGPPKRYMGPANTYLQLTHLVFEPMHRQITQVLQDRLYAAHAHLNMPLHRRPGQGRVHVREELGQRAASARSNLRGGYPDVQCAQQPPARQPVRPWPRRLVREGRHKAHA